MTNELIRYGVCVDLKIVVIYINLSILIICKNGLSILNTRYNFRSVLYLCETSFKDYYP